MVDNTGELPRILGDLPAEWLRAIEVRAKLRLLPLVGDPIFAELKGLPFSPPQVTLRFFRLLALAWGAAKFPPGFPEAAQALDAVSVAEENFRDVVERSFQRYSEHASNAAAALAVMGCGEGILADAAGVASVGGPPADTLHAMIAADCAAMNGKSGPGGLLAAPLWRVTPSWFADSWRHMREDLGSSKEGLAIWAEWFEARLNGESTAFAGFDTDADGEFYRRLFAAFGDLGDENGFWHRSDSLVNGEIARWVAELRNPVQISEADLEQNSRAFTFSVNEEGVSVLDAELPPNGVQNDADARDNHAEVRRLVDRAIIATRDQPTQAIYIKAPLELLRDAVGDSIETLKPRLFVLRAKELIRQCDEAESDGPMVIPLSEHQRTALLPLLRAVEMLAEFDPKLAALWSGRIGETAKPLTKVQLHAIADGLRELRLTHDDAQEVIQTCIGQVETAAGEDDPARNVASATVRNVARAFGKAYKWLLDGIDGAQKIETLWRWLKPILPEDEPFARILRWLLGMFGSGSA